MKAATMVVSKFLMGEMYFEELEATYQAFWGLAADIRVQLGTSKALLDSYLEKLLAVTNRIYSASEVAQSEQLSKDKRAQIAKLVDKEYLQQYPLPYSTPHTQTAVYLSESYHQIIGVLLANYNKAVMTEETQAILSQANDLYESIVGIIGGEQDMIKLNELFSKHFLRYPLVESYAQAAINCLIETLLERDPESDGTILQLLLNRK